jgi:hypothetical protein
VKDTMMIEISISREFAAEHPGFLAGCAERGHDVQVFGTSDARLASHTAETGDPDSLPDAAYIGQPYSGA